jgi:hypothetical protein
MVRRIMVAPGFYVYGSAVKCEVLCRYLTNSNNINNCGNYGNKQDKGSTPSP